MSFIAASSHYSKQINDGDTLDNLDPILRPLCREPFRRIDRFIQLALMGSAQCVAGRDLPPDTALYISTRIGPIGNNIVVQEALIRDHLLPKPFHFVNTLGSSSGYYIAKNLGLTGQSLFISRHSRPLDAALEVALADLELGVVERALVGQVEEVTLPLSDHRKRLVLDAGAPGVEQSHWMLLEKGGTIESSKDGWEKLVSKELLFKYSGRSIRS